MNILKVTSSGQISIPKYLRVKYDTDYFQCNGTAEGILFSPIKKKEVAKKKYTIADMKKFMFKDNDPDKDWSSKIDEIVYQL